MRAVVHPVATQRTMNSLPDRERRKRLGQYFTGLRLARLLAVLAGGRLCHEAIDPMCGSGDMLAAVKMLSPKASLSGIEIDAAAAAICADRFRDSPTGLFHLVVGNAFAWETVRQLPRASFDLVITNPPYVRYQSLAGSRTDHPDLPNAEAVRRGVRDIVDQLHHLGHKERKILQVLIDGYSGLSDLAVPAWLLCAGLTQVGGRLAMIVPEAWLSRDYARPIQYLLLKLFRIQYVVEDLHRSWFDESLIKTTLVVAERVPAIPYLAENLADKDYLHITLPSSAANQQSVVGQLFPESPHPELDFAQALTNATFSWQTSTHPDLSIKRRALSSALDRIVTADTQARWFSVLEPGMRPSAYVAFKGTKNASTTLPAELTAAVPEAARLPLVTLAELGVRVGQGLRTGANAFFYANLISEQNGTALIAPIGALPVKMAEVPSSVLLPVVRRQSDAPSGYLIDPAMLRGRVLVLDTFVHPDDATSQERFAQEPMWGASGRRVMPEGLAALVTAAARTNLGTPDAPRFIPELSAVHTNSSRGSLKTGALPRFWYMLPEFAPRHLPDLFVARVNSRHPKVMLNSQPATVVDANFSTIWREDEAKVTAAALLAVLNSSWTIAMMELLGTVMGGGALKLEATHLRRLPLPQLSSELWSELDRLGSQLLIASETAPIHAHVDRLIGVAAFSEDRAEEVLQRIRQAAEKKLSARGAKG